MQKLQRLPQIWRERGTLGVIRLAFRFIQKTLQGEITYAKWVEQHHFGDAEVRVAQRQIAKWALQPKFSLILLVENVEAICLERAIAAVQQQIYPHWELWIIVSAALPPQLQAIAQQAAQSDPRIQVLAWAEQGNSVAAKNAALELATGEYLAFLAPQSLLAINALFANARWINQHPTVDLIYSDEDQITTQGDRCHPFFKPDWSPDYFHAWAYTGQLSVYRLSLVRAIAGLRNQYAGAETYDLTLRLVEQTQEIHHIPQVLYHSQVINPSAMGSSSKQIATRKALEDMLARSPYGGNVEEIEQSGYFRVRPGVLERPLVSILIPSAGKVSTIQGEPVCLLENCIRSIQERSTYLNFEIILVDGYDIRPEVLEQLSAPNLHLVRSKDPFNFSQRLNLAAEKASGEFLLLLNDDTEIITPNWLESMLEFAQQPDIGAVGAKLLFPDGKIQHVGVLLLEDGPGHMFYGAESKHPGYFGSNILNHNALAVTAACLMMRREVFQQLGGFDIAFPLNYNDVDLCLKAHQAGYRNVVIPAVTLVHYESISRQGGFAWAELKRFQQKWKSYLHRLGGDPYYNPNLATQRTLFWTLDN